MITNPSAAADQRVPHTPCRWRLGRTHPRRLGTAVRCGPAGRAYVRWAARPVRLRREPRRPGNSGSDGLVTRGRPIYGPVGTCDIDADLEPGYLVVPRADSAINAALHAIGIRADPGLDEYAAVGLTRQPNDR